MNPIIIIPGIMGSKLYKNNECLWIDFGLIGGKDLKKLIIDSPITLKCEKCLQDVKNSPYCDYEKYEAKVKHSFTGITQDMFIFNVFGKNPFKKLEKHLSEKLNYKTTSTNKKRNLFVFTYDWRLCNRISAKKLSNYITELKKKEIKANQKIDIIAHSMGGLIARDYIENLGGNNFIDKLIMLGTPNYGAVSAFQVLLQGAPLPTVGKSISQKLPLTIPSIYQLLPNFNFCYQTEDGNFLNIYENLNWLPAKYRTMLSTRNFNTILKESIGKTVYYSIAGYYIPTLNRVFKTNGDYLFEQAFNLEGDGTVLNESAILKEVKRFYVKDSHINLPGNHDVFKIIEHIIKGKEMKKFIKKEPVEDKFIRDQERIARQELYSTEVTVFEETFPMEGANVNAKAWLINSSTIMDQTFYDKPYQELPFLQPNRKMSKKKGKSIYTIEFNLKDKGIYKIAVYGSGKLPDRMPIPPNSPSGRTLHKKIEFFVLRV